MQMAPTLYDGASVCTISSRHRRGSRLKILSSARCTRRRTVTALVRLLVGSEASELVEQLGRARRQRSALVEVLEVHELASLEVVDHTARLGEHEHAAEVV